MVDKFITATVIVAELSAFALIVSIIVWLVVTSNPKLWNRFVNLGVEIGTYDYKGYAINYDLYGRKEYTVSYYGHDWEFKTIRGATDFIDSVIENQKARKARRKFIAIK